MAREANICCLQTDSKFLFLLQAALEHYLDRVSFGQCRFIEFEGHSNSIEALEVDRPLIL